jgi:hypothetical protein
MDNIGAESVAELRRMEEEAKGQKIKQETLQNAAEA